LTAPVLKIIGKLLMAVGNVSPSGISKPAGLFTGRRGIFAA
jgi:hypothetical protein